MMAAYRVRLMLCSMGPARGVRSPGIEPGSSGTVDVWEGRCLPGVSVCTVALPL